MRSPIRIVAVLIASLGCHSSGVSPSRPEQVVASPSNLEATVGARLDSLNAHATFYAKQLSTGREIAIRPAREPGIDGGHAPHPSPAQVYTSRLPQRVRFRTSMGHKTGDWPPPLGNDVGIMYAPPPTGPIVIAVFTNKTKDSFFDLEATEKAASPRTC
jgi:hypothetical protein